MNFAIRQNSRVKQLNYLQVGSNFHAISPSINYHQKCRLDRRHFVLGKKLAELDRVKKMTKRIFRRQGAPQKQGNDLPIVSRAAFEEQRSIREIIAGQLLLLVFALLISNTARGLASRLARGLAFAASAVLCTLAKVLCIKCLNTLHKIYPPINIDLYCNYITQQPPSQVGLSKKYLHSFSVDTWSSLC